MRRFLFLLLALVVLTPAGEAKEFTTRDGRPIRNVAIVSRLGDQAILFHAVPTVPIGTFVPRTRSVLIPDFGIDVRIAEKIAQAIKPLNVVPLDAGAVGYLPWDRQTAGANVRKWPPRADIDAYIVVCPDDSLDEVGDTMLTIRGYGLYHRWRLVTYTTAVFAIYRIMLIDARTGETIADRESGIESGFLEPSVAKIDIERRRWPGDEMQLTPDQLHLLREDLNWLFEHSLSYTLKKLKLSE